MAQDTSKKLAGKKVAILVTDGFEQIEMTSPRDALKAAGADTKIVSLKPGKIQGWKHFDKADSFDVDLQVTSAKAADFDALMLPGGVANPDQLRMNKDAVAFVKDFAQSGKPIAAICHGPWTLIDAEAVKGRRVTSWPSLKTDLKNAGAQWSDEKVVTDKGLVTSRKPDDLPDFNAKMIEEFAEGIHQRKAA